MHEITEAELKEAAKFTDEELALINDTLERVVEKEPRPMVLLGIAIHAIGLTIHQSDGVLKKEALLEIVGNSIEV